MRLAVFCGSATGKDEIYAQAAAELGQFLANNGVDLVYGGGGVGLMGIIASAVMDSGGKAYGVIPDHLVERELAHHGLTQLDVVEDMHQRKARMAQLADAFVAMPGGAGTLEELFEVWTWAQLGYHQKPCAFYNVNNFFDPLLNFVGSISEAGFLKPQYLQMLIVENEPSALISAITNYQPPEQKWSN